VIRVISLPPGLSGIVSLAVIALVSGCENYYCLHGGECDPGFALGALPVPLPPPSSPENVIEALEITYNDKVRGADERLAIYAGLFTSTFIFRLQPDDVAQGLPEQWGLRDELGMHERLFGAQDLGDVFSIELRVDHEPARDLTPPVSGRAGWKEVFAPFVYLRLMFNIHEGIEVNGSQAQFLFPPAERGRFRIAEWNDLPNPSQKTEATWGRVKLHYNPGRSHGVD